MDVSTVGRKRRRLTIALAVVGFVMAAVIWAYSELTDSSPPKPFNSTLWYTPPQVGCCRATFGCCLGTIKKSAAYEISGAVQRHAGALR